MSTKITNKLLRNEVFISRLVRSVCEISKKVLGFYEMNTESSSAIDIIYYRFISMIRSTYKNLTGETFKRFISEFDKTKLDRKYISWVPRYKHFSCHN